MPYICLECGCVFDEPATYKEPHTELDGCPYETFTVCPACNDTGIEEAEVCDVCGEYIPKSEAATMGLGGVEARVCEHCREFNEELEEI